MSISKLAKKIVALSSPNSPRYRTSQLRGFLSANNGFESKSLISQNFSRIQRNYSSSSIMDSQHKKSKSLLKKLVGLVTLMVGLTYASAPLYDTFCRQTGFGGRTKQSLTVEQKIARDAQDESTPTREIVVQFNADVNEGLLWKFIPAQREVRVKPGESSLAFFSAENQSSTPIKGVSSYNVTPIKAGKYFTKIQCFCFEEQCLYPGEKIDMPVFFYIDPAIETDPTMKDVHDIILSYTFFKVKE